MVFKQWTGAYANRVPTRLMCYSCSVNKASVGSI